MLDTDIFYCLFSMIASGTFLSESGSSLSSGGGCKRGLEEMNSAGCEDSPAGWTGRDIIIELEAMTLLMPTDFFSCFNLIICLCLFLFVHIISYYFFNSFNKKVYS
jgi:hypothetical protein